jgi:glycosyltransferase involved in cell wall biosynthesis
VNGGIRSIAVIVPAFNAAATLAAALGSVAGQSVAPTEVVIVDDGSTDDTVRIAERWKALLPVRVVSLPSNGGPGRARNEGVRSSTAPMLAFLDADDIWFPDHLQTCLSLQEQSGGVVTGRGLRWHEGRDIAAGQVDDEDAGPPPDGTLEWLVGHHSFGMHAVMPRSIFEKVGGFDPTTEGVEDWDLWIRIAETGVPMRRTPTRTFFYRQHDNNLSLQVDRVGEAGLRVLDRLARERNPVSKELRFAIRDSRALIAFNRASARLDTGDYRAARRFAVTALRGPTRLAVRAAAIVAAPALFARLRDRRRARLPAAAATPDLLVDRTKVPTT